MRDVSSIVIHCSATRSRYDVANIEAWHKKLGFTTVGYHFVILYDGSFIQYRGLNTVGAHCKGFNRDSIGICYVGGLLDGVPCDTRSECQKITFRKLITELLYIYGHPLSIYSHHDLNPKKSCPCFDARLEYNHLNDIFMSQSYVSFFQTLPYNLGIYE